MGSGNVLSLLLGAASDSIKTGIDAACSSSCNKVDLSVSFSNVANLLTFIVGAISVIMIIVGALRYVISQGDSKAVQTAKDTILYAVIGVVVSILAFGIVSFVNTSLSTTSKAAPVTKAK